MLTRRTQKYDKNPALKGKQSNLPDELQKKIITARLKHAIEKKAGAHTLVTGHSGAGKSTLARSFGLPIYALDDDPAIREQLEAQMAYARANSGRLPLSDDYAEKMRVAEQGAIARALALEEPHVIEGSYLLNKDPSDLTDHALHLVDTPEDVVLDRRVERQRVKDLARGRHWDDERAAGVRMRGQQLINEYRPGVAKWRAAQHVKTASVATKRDPEKWARAKADAKARMGGKHSARAMQLATKLYKQRGGSYAGKKPAPSQNKLRKWTKQDWQWSGGDTPGQGGKGVYLPKRSASALKSTEQGRAKLESASRVKSQATARGQQFSSHGLHVGKKRGDVT